MKCPPFSYHRATGVADAVAALDAADGEGKILAGGQSLMPVLALRMARPEVLVDINHVPGLARLERRGDTLHLGALVRHLTLAEQDQHPLLAEAARWIGHTAIRSRGTVAGSLAHADPSAELPSVLLACDGAVHVAGPGTAPAGRRRRPLRRHAPDRPGRRRDDHRGRAARPRRLGLLRDRPPPRRLRHRLGRRHPLRRPNPRRGRRRGRRPAPRLAPRQRPRPADRLRRRGGRPRPGDRRRRRPGRRAGLRPARERRRTGAPSPARSSAAPSSSSPGPR